MTTDDNVGALLALIYDSCLNPNLWVEFLDQLAVALNSVGAVLFVHESEGARTEISLNARLDISTQRAYNDYYYKKDVWVLRAQDFLKSGNVYTSEMACSEAELARTEFFNDYLRPLGVRHGMCGQVSTAGGTTCALAACRSRRAGLFGQGEIALFSVLLPHVSRALAVQARLANLHAETQAVVEALDHLSAGCFLLDARGRVSFLNHAAQGMIEANDGISVERELLTLGTAAQYRELNLLIAGAAETASGATTIPPGSMLVQRPSLRRPYSLMLSPLSENAPFLLQRPAAVMIVITDPDALGQTDALCSMYKFTAKETQLARILISGSSLVKAASQLRVTVNTAKTHLSGIFAKTGVRRQSDLIRLFSTAATAMIGKNSAQRRPVVNRVDRPINPAHLTDQLEKRT